MIVGVLVQIYPTNNLLKWSGALFILGSCSLAVASMALVLTQIKLFGPVTPLGGVAFIAGWLLLAYALFKSA